MRRDVTFLIARQFPDVSEPLPTLYEFLPRPGEAGEPDPRDAAQRLGSAPDVLKLGEAGGVVFNREWQEYLVAINPNMSLNNAAAIMKSNRWGFNQGHGLPEHVNYIENDAGDGNDPDTDKDRTFAFNVHAGIESGGELLLTMFDGTKSPPPLEYDPQRPTEPVINPQTHPWMYLVLTVVYKDGHTGSFPNGGLVEGFAQVVTLFPLVAKAAIRYPLDKVRRVTAWKMPY